MRQWLEQSVRTHLIPAFVERGFSMRMPPRGDDDLPPWGRLSRVRESGITDLVDTQFSSHGRAAFRINACAVPKEGLRTVAGRRMAEGLEAGGLHAHFETRARPWLRAVPVVSAFADWFSVWPRPFRTRTQRDYDELVLSIVSVIIEIDIALREGTSGSHIRHVVFPEKALME